MFKNKKFLIAFIVEAVIPLIVAIPGALSIYFFHNASGYYTSNHMEDYNRLIDLFKLLHKITLISGITAAILLNIAGLVSFILMLVHAFSSHKEKYCVARPCIIWLWSGACAFGALMLMLLIQAFTYGMSV